MTDLAQAQTQATPTVEAQTQETPNPSGEVSHADKIFGQPAKADAPKEGEKPAEQKPEGEKPAEGEEPSGDGKKEEPKKEEGKEGEVKIVLKAPDGSALKAEQVDKIADYAKKRGLSQDQAQVLLEFSNEAFPEITKGLKSEKEFLDGQQADVVKHTKEWVTTIQSDKEMGGDKFTENTELARRVMHKYGSEDFRKALDTTGLGNQPELVRFCMRVGRAMGMDKFVQGGKPPMKEETSHADKIWGKKESNAN